MITPLAVSPLRAPWPRQAILLGVLLTTSLTGNAQAPPDSSAPPASSAPSAPSEKKGQLPGQQEVERVEQPSVVEPQGQLPWSNRDLSNRPPESPREMLRLFDIGESQLRSLFDGQPLGAEDEETLTTFLYRFPRMGEDTIFLWRTSLTLEELAAAPAAHRGVVAHVRGVVQQMEQRELIPELSRLYGFRRYWLLSVASADSPHPVQVATRNIPAAWGDEPADDLDFGCEFDGFFLKTAAETAPAPLIFAASRVRWRPVRPRPEFGIGDSQLLLARHGVDMGWLEVIKEQNSKPLGSADRAAFYEMLKASSILDDQDLQTVEPRQASLAALLVQPDELFGQLLRLKVRAARITRVTVGDQDIQRMQGIDHYYQIDAFLPLGDQSVRLGEGQDAPEYRNSFPMTICMVDLPPSMQEIDKRMAAGESPVEVYERELRVTGFFYRIWSYRAGFIDQRTPGKLQPAPMILASRMDIVSLPGVSADALSLAFGVGFVSLLALVCGLLWWTSRKDAVVDKELQGKRFKTKQSLDQLDLPGAAEPDLSHLNEQD